MPVFSEFWNYSKYSNYASFSIAGLWIFQVHKHVRSQITIITLLDPHETGYYEQVGSCHYARLFGILKFLKIFELRQFFHRWTLNFSGSQTCLKPDHHYSLARSSWNLRLWTSSVLALCLAFRNFEIPQNVRISPVFPSLDFVFFRFTNMSKASSPL